MMSRLILFMTLFVASFSFAQNVSIFKDQGGNRLTIGSGAELDIKSGAILDFESGSSFALGGVAVTASAVELNTVHAALTIADVSSTGPAGRVAAPGAGTVDDMNCFITGAPGADSLITLSINGVNVTGGTVTILSASVADSKYTMGAPTGANTVAVGDNLTITSNASASNSIATFCTVHVGR